MRGRVKRPVEFAMNIIRGLEARVQTNRLGSDLAKLGENLYNPPSPNGWEAGQYWINSLSMIGRSNLAADLLADSGDYGGKLDPAAVTQSHGRAGGEAGARFLADLFIQPGGDDKTFEKIWKAAPGDKLSERMRSYARSLVMLPEFQLA
jgi:hypothetical protein